MSDDGLAIRTAEMTPEAYVTRTPNNGVIELVTNGMPPGIRGTMQAVKQRLAHAATQYNPLKDASNPHNYSVGFDTTYHRVGTKPLREPTYKKHLGQRLRMAKQRPTPDGVKAAFSQAEYRPNQTQPVPNRIVGAKRWTPQNDTVYRLDEARMFSGNIKAHAKSQGLPYTALEKAVKAELQPRKETTTGEHTESKSTVSVSTNGVVPRLA